MRNFLIFCLALVPFSHFKCILFRKMLGYKIGRGVKIGFSFLDARECVLDDGASIGNFNIIHGLAHFRLSRDSTVGNFNRISSALRNSNSFPAVVLRDAGVTVGCYAAITSRHFMDVQANVSIGDFTTLAGAGTSIWTHQINVYENRQEVGSVSIGAYCFIGAGSTFLAGSGVPDRCVLAACSVVTKLMDVGESLYAGNPAVLKKSLSGAKYFSRTIGYVD